MSGPLMDQKLNTNQEAEGKNKWIVLMREVSLGGVPTGTP